MIKFLRLQPGFTIDAPYASDEVVKKMRTALKTNDMTGFADAASMCFDYKIEPASQRFWSPHLSVQVSDANDSDSTSMARLHCRFAPRPEIWTMFIAIYFVILILMFAAMILAYVQWWMGGQPWALAMVPLGIVFIVVLHVASQIGQSLSSDQMTLLQSRLDQTLAIAGIAQPGHDSGVAEQRVTA
ncbi:hypothetical protein [Rubripirellula reticaptiva]|uniref:Uncharacterized protein n=1 Tax=Rubripirellula reticaptiva TaxID=2528013 RepID=A0A5C6F6N2_9BACT|nr:hypothetical protein [Rubripirellula reticaptiva]TWU55161.1 hypothetical protein Poly59_14570 [Rubripirellula reticaptiva]